MKPVSEILPNVMCNIMSEQDNESLVNLILDYPDSVVIKGPASKILLERDLTAQELLVIINNVPEYVDIAKERMNGHNVQLELNFKES